MGYYGLMEMDVGNYIHDLEFDFNELIEFSLFWDLKRSYEFLTLDVSCNSWLETKPLL